MLKLTISAVNLSFHSHRFTVNIAFNSGEINVSLDAASQSVFVTMYVHEKKEYRVLVLMFFNKFDSF